MSLHLKTNGIIDKDWSTVKYECRLLCLNSDPHCNDTHCNDLIRSGEDRNFVGSGKLGWNKFIPARKLSPFKRNDEIKIRVHLST